MTPTLGFSNLVMAFQFTVDTVDPPAPTERQPVAIGVTAQSSQGAGALGPKVRRGDVIGLTGANMDLATSVYFDSIPAKICGPTASTRSPSSSPTACRTGRSSPASAASPA